MIKSTINKIKCKLGLHNWEQNKELRIYDISPNPFDSKHETPRRSCKNCKWQQKWLPGYGGSEIGCWWWI